MQLLSTSGSLSLAHTTSRLAASWTCPLMVMAIGVLRRFAHRYRARAGRGESAFIAARHCAHGDARTWRMLKGPLKGSRPGRSAATSSSSLAGGPRPALALRVAKERAHACDQRRWLSDPCRGRGPGTCAGAHAVE